MKKLKLVPVYCRVCGLIGKCEKNSKVAVIRIAEVHQIARHREG